MNKTRYWLLLGMLTCLAPSITSAQDLQAGDKLQLLSNLHPDTRNNRLYSMNYQLPFVLPVCTEVTVQKVSRKKMIFNARGLKYTFLYDKHTRKAGVSFQESLQQFFGPKCDAAKMKRLSKLDRDGIRRGTPIIGMTKQGILFAMGRPPYHVNPDLETQYWMYWRNKFARRAVEFNDKGKVSNIR